MDELLGDFWDQAGYRAPARAATAFVPRVDVYYCGDDRPEKAVVKVDLPGVDVEAINLEVRGRSLVITGERPVRETEGRTYQQVELPSGPVPPRRRAPDRRPRRRGPGLLRGRHPARRAAGAAARRGPPGPDREGDRGAVTELETPEIEVVELPEIEDAVQGEQPLPDALPILPLRETVTFPDTLTPLAVGQERSIKLVNDVLSGNRMLAMVASKDPENDTPGPDDLYGVGVAGHGRADDEGARRHAPHPRPGRRAGEALGLRHRDALPGRARRADGRRGEAEPRARGAHPQRPEHLQRDHRADPLPARGAPARRHQPRRPLGARPPDRRRAADLGRGEAGAARGARRRQEAPPPLGDPDPRARGGPPRHQDPVPGRVRDRQGPARVLPARADEGDPGGARRDRRPGRPRSTSSASGSRRRSCPRRPRRRPTASSGRLEKLPSAAAEYGVIRSYLEWLVDLPWSVETEDNLDIKHAKRGPQRGPLRPRGHQGPDPRVPGRPQAEPGVARPDPLLRRPARRRQDQPRQVDRPRARAASSSASRSAASATRPRSAATAAPTSARCPARSSARSATRAPATPCS